MKKININIRNYWIGILFFITFPFYSQSVESTLWGPNGVNWNPAGRLPDFSYAGYKSSESPLPNVAVISNLNTTTALPNDDIDDTAALQGLINAQSSLPLNSRGAVIIPAGRWIIDNQLNLNIAGVVLRGEVDVDGKPISEFYFPNPSAADNQYHINMNGTLSITKLANVSTNVDQGQTIIPLSYTTAATFSTGDFVQLTLDDNASTRSLSSYLHGDLDMIGATAITTTSVYNNLFYFYAKVISVTASSITLDRPIPVKIQTDWFPTLNKFNVNASTTEMGIENLIMSSPNNTLYVHGTGPEPRYKYLKMTQIVNCWVKNVVIKDSEDGIRIDTRSCFNTIKGITFKQDIVNNTAPPAFEPSSSFVRRFQQNGKAGHHPIWIFNAHFNLVEDFKFEDVYWHELSVEGAAAYNVFRNGSGVAMAFDNHRLIPYSNLWTNINIGRPERMWWNSGSNSGTTFRGPNSGFRTTYWGISYTAVSPGLPLPNASIDGFGFLNCIGVPGATKQSSPVDKVNSQLIEINGTDETVAQPDLFIAQLNRRLGNLSVNENLKEVSLIKLYPSSISKGESLNIARQDSDKAILSIFDIQGHLLYEMSSSEKNIVIKELDFSSGMYFLKIKTDTSSGKVLKFFIN